VGVGVGLIPRRERPSFTKQKLFCREPKWPNRDVELFSTLEYK
jgi:hypothetical protein